MKQKCDGHKKKQNNTFLVGLQVHNEQEQKAGFIQELPDLRLDETQRTAGAPPTGRPLVLHLSASFRGRSRMKDEIIQKKSN